MPCVHVHRGVYEAAVIVVIIADEKWGWHNIIVKRSVVGTAFVAATVIDARAIANVITIHIVIDVAIVNRFIVIATKA